MAAGLARFSNQYFVEFEPPVEATNYKRYLLGLHTDIFGHFDYDGSILYLHQKPLKMVAETKVDGKTVVIKLRERLDATASVAGTEDEKGKGEGNPVDMERQIRSRVELLFARKERPEWIPDTASSECEICLQPFGVFRRRHHCRGCGHIFCKECSNFFLPLPVQYNYGTVPQRLCSICYNALSEKNNPVEEATTKAQYYLRASNTYEFADSTKILSDIGSKRPPEKVICFVKTPGAIQSEQLMTVLDASNAPSSMTKLPFCKLLQEKLQHPYIQPYINTDYRADKKDVVIFREFSPKGSLKDYIHRGIWSGANPRDPYTKKYASAGKPLPIAEIAKYGRQILDGLAFLQSLGIIHYHLHTGNVLLVDNVVKFTDIENSLLKLQPRFTFTAKQLTPDVEAFSYLLFEMATGTERDTGGLEGLITSNLPGNCVKEIHAILKCIWDSDGTANPTTVSELLKMPPFNTVADKDLVPFEKKVKLSPKMNTFLEEIRNSVTPFLQELEGIRRREKFPATSGAVPEPSSPPVGTSSTKGHQRVKSLDRTSSTPAGLTADTAGSSPERAKSPPRKGGSKLKRAATTASIPTATPKVP